MVWLSYNESYEVSDDGYVMNKKTGKIIPGNDNGKGYLRMMVYLSCKNICIHQMIAARFCPKIDVEGLTVDHIDRNKLNNNASNLRWVSRGVQNRNVSVSKNNILQEKHISPNKKSFHVRIKKNSIYLINNYFKSLPEAIEARDLILNSVEYNT